MTNTVNNIISFVTSNPINWTIVLSFTSVSIAAMVAYINIYKSKKHVSDDELRESNLIIEMKEKSQKLEEKHESLKETANILKIDVEKLKIETNMNIGSTIVPRISIRQKCEVMSGAIRSALTCG